MTERRIIKEHMDLKYSDRGGWKGLVDIFSDSTLLYKDKLRKVEEQYNVDISTATGWYKRYRALIGLR